MHVSNSRMLLPFGSKCSIEQYRMLQRCSKEKDCQEWNTWRRSNPSEDILLQGAEFGGFFLEGANFSNAHLEFTVFHSAHCKDAFFVFAKCDNAIFSGADCNNASFLSSQCTGTIFFETNCSDAKFWGASCINTCFSKSECIGTTFFGEANLTGADFTDAICTNADFTDANLCDANFKKSDISGAIFTNTIVNQSSKFVHSTIDDKTLFLNSSLMSVIIEPGSRAKLEQNARRESWMQWYEEKGLLASIPAKIFWYISDYGYSTSMIFLFFLISSMFFAVFYTLFPQMISDSAHTACEPFWLLFLRMLAFSIATMVTLGFGNINVANSPISYCGILVVTLNLLTGYFLLAVLVTRLAVLFQTLGPGYITPKKTPPNNDKSNNTSIRSQNGSIKSS